MDRTYIDHHHVVARYLADRLSDEERKDFEAFLLSNPDVVQDLEAAARIKAGLRKLSRNGELDALLQPSPWYRNRRNLAWAASIAAIAIIALLWTGRSALEPSAVTASLQSMTDRAGKRMSIGNVYSILRMRGPSYDAEIELPETPKAIELRVLPEVEVHPALYRIVLARVADDGALTVLGNAANLNPNEDGFVTVYLDSSRVAPGRFRLTLSGERNTDGAAIESAFKIRLLAPPPRAP